MKIRDFGLEIFFGRYEFSAPYLLAQSDCESLSIRELLALEPGAQEGFLDTWLGYSENDGAPALREAVSGLYTQCGPENVLLHVGAQEAIFGALNVLVEPGEHVICQFPTYQSLYEVARAAGCELSLWPLHQGKDGWYCDLDELERLITPKTRLLVLNTPNNPTGYALSADERQRICDLARRHGLRILADEVYRGLEAPEAVPPAFCDIYERAFSVGVLSKAYGLPGLRVGWIASQERDAIGALSRYKNYLSICCPTPSEALARIALKHGPAVLARNREIIARNRRIAADFFARYEHVFLHNPSLSTACGRTSWPASVPHWLFAIIWPSRPVCCSCPAMSMTWTRPMCAWATAAPTLPRTWPCWTTGCGRMPKCTGKQFDK